MAFPLFNSQERQYETYGISTTLFNKIIIDLDVMLARHKMKLQDLAVLVGIRIQNLSILKNGGAKAIRFETLNAICQALDCQPGDLLRFETEQNLPFSVKIPNKKTLKAMHDADIGKTYKNDPSSGEKKE